MCHRIVINSRERVERQLAKFEDFSHRGTHRHRPVVGSKVVFPGVILGPHIPALAEVLDDERLDGVVAHVRFFSAARAVGVVPMLPAECAELPSLKHRVEIGPGRTGLPLAATQEFTASAGGKHERGPQADHLPFRNGYVAHQ